MTRYHNPDEDPIKDQNPDLDSDPQPWNIWLGQGSKEPKCWSEFGSGSKTKWWGSATLPRYVWLDQGWLRNTLVIWFLEWLDIRIRMRNQLRIRTRIRVGLGTHWLYDFVNARYPNPGDIEFRIRIRIRNRIRNPIRYLARPGFEITKILIWNRIQIQNKIMRIRCSS